MAKSYIEELADWVQKRPKKKPRQDAAAVAFMAVKSDVIEAIEAGYALTTIWEHMNEIEKLKCSYETFRKHVRKYIKQAVPRNTKNAEQEKSQGAKSGQKQETMPSKADGFAFDAKPKKEDLI
ncbi:MAG: TraK family protein [Candidatus Thiodiazotropha sp. (ex Dulcina madagascariensis)]|nr:TraK family protein [Candidatus Thiodiazotropha sp. (ex Dulcina madagascariensis)]